jgi:hypothetical protein
MRTVLEDGFDVSPGQTPALLQPVREREDCRPVPANDHPRILEGKAKVLTAGEVMDLVWLLAPGEFFENVRQIGAEQPKRPARPQGFGGRAGQCPRHHLAAWPLGAVQIGRMVASPATIARGLDDDFECPYRLPGAVLDVEGGHRVATFVNCHGPSIGGPVFCEDGAHLYPRPPSERPDPSRPGRNPADVGPRSARP